MPCSLKTLEIKHMDVNCSHYSPFVVSWASFVASFMVEHSVTTLKEHTPQSRNTKHACKTRNTLAKHETLLRNIKLNESRVSLSNISNYRIN